MYSSQSQLCKTPDLGCCCSADKDNQHSYPTRPVGMAFVFPVWCRIQLWSKQSALEGSFSPYSILPLVCSQRRGSTDWCVPQGRTPCRRLAPWSLVHLTVMFRPWFGSTPVARCLPQDRGQRAWMLVLHPEHWSDCRKQHPFWDSHSSLAVK